MGGGLTRSAWRAVAPELLWLDGRFRAGQAVFWDPDSGRILRVGPADEPPAADTSGPAGEVGVLPGRALLPGFVNAHSHAFQRLLRGRTQWRPAGRVAADFWTWREAMYRAARRLSPEEVEAVSRFCFLEMLLAGYTTVGEFHYLRRDPAGRPYGDPNELARRVLAAASAAGIRIALLNAAYAARDSGRLLRPEQARFATPDLDAFLRETRNLAADIRGDTLVSVGLAPHSVRAVPRAWMRPLAEFSEEEGVPLHMHVSEQPAEVERCRAAYGLGPGELAAEEGLLSPRFTAVHATHLSPREVALFGEAGATACICPTTEADLGDGVPPAEELQEAGVALALGSDSHTVIDPFEEMRLLEYGARLRSLRRVVLSVRGEDGRAEVGPRLLTAATAGGGRSLGLPVGRLEPGAPADFTAIDLGSPALAGWSPGSLPGLLALCGTSATVRDVWVAGRRLVRDGRHPLEEDAAEAFRRVAAGLESGAP